ncbi:hypothetical protein [Staphylococcus chromogenes]|uniref:hypothetical protein n=1 Tax=Staphylococcus chromogenes TaxID=46126 RepID=UPI002DB8555C|nr:hypothetical protein [Staphylococcus chromogenes]MEB7824949.1 hypothetical protein [Staphylococcus chromogenes]
MGAARYEYVVYKGEEVVASGTMREIMKKLNIAEGTFYTLLATKTLEREAESYRKGKRNGQMVAIKVDIAEIERESGVV